MEPDGGDRAGNVLVEPYVGEEALGRLVEGDSHDAVGVHADAALVGAVSEQDRSAEGAPAGFRVAGMVFVEHRQLPGRLRRPAVRRECGLCPGAIELDLGFQRRPLRAGHGGFHSHSHSDGDHQDVGGSWAAHSVEDFRDGEARTCRSGKQTRKPVVAASHGSVIALSALACATISRRIASRSPLSILVPAFRPSRNSRAAPALRPITGSFDSAALAMLSCSVVT